MTPAGGPSAFGLSHVFCGPRRAVTGKIRTTEEGRRVAQGRWATDESTHRTPPRSLMLRFP